MEWCFSGGRRGVHRGAEFGELFRTRSRAIGVGFAVALASAVFGGTAPYLNEWLTSIGRPEAFIWYLVGLAVCTAVTAFFSPETRGTQLGEVTAREHQPAAERESA